MRIRLLRMGNTAIYAHAGTLLFALYMMASGQGGLLTISMLSILLHEGAHAVASVIAGHPQREIELSPLGAVMRLDEYAEISPSWQVIILLAGPAMTLTLCSSSILMTRLHWLPLAIGRTLFMCNLSILVLNLLPALPLDGGRVLGLCLGRFFPPSVVNSVIRAISTTVGLGCIAANLWVTWQYGGWNLSLAVAGCFIIYAGTTATISTALHELRSFMDRKIRLEVRGALPSTSITALESTSLRSAVMLCHPRRHTMFYVLSEDMQHGKFLHEEQVIQGYMRTPGGTLKDLVDFR